MNSTENSIKNIQQRERQEHNKYYFILKPLSKDLWIKQEVIVGFGNHEEESQNNKQLASLPKYNKNSQCFTPSFIVGVGQDQKQIRDQLQLKIPSYTKNQQILQPKPTKSYCHVCQQRYDDYLKHISHIHHKKKLLLQIPNSQIQQLAQKVVKFKEDKIKRRDTPKQCSIEMKKKRIVDQMGMITVKSLKSFKDSQSTLAETQWNNKFQQTRSQNHLKFK